MVLNMPAAPKKNMPQLTNTNDDKDFSLVERRTDTKTMTIQPKSSLAVQIRSLANTLGLNWQLGDLMVYEGQIYIKKNGWNRIANAHKEEYDGIEIELVDKHYEKDYMALVKAKGWRKGVSHPFEDMGYCVSTEHGKEKMLFTAIMGTAITRAKDRVLQTMFSPSDVMPFDELPDDIQKQAQPVGEDLLEKASNITEAEIVNETPNLAPNDTKSATNPAQKTINETAPSIIMKKKKTGRSLTVPEEPKGNAVKAEEEVKTESTGSVEPPAEPEPNEQNGIFCPICFQVSEYVIDGRSKCPEHGEFNNDMTAEQFQQLIDHDTKKVYKQAEDAVAKAEKEALSQAQPPAEPPKPQPMITAPTAPKKRSLSGTTIPTPAPAPVASPPPQPDPQPAVEEPPAEEETVEEESEEEESSEPQPDPDPNEYIRAQVARLRNEFKWDNARIQAEEEKVVAAEKGPDTEPLAIVKILIGIAESESKPAPVVKPSEEAVKAEVPTGNSTAPTWLIVNPEASNVGGVAHIQLLAVPYHENELGTPVRMNYIGGFKLTQGCTVHAIENKKFKPHHLEVAEIIVNRNNDLMNAYKATPDHPAVKGELFF
jgi:hypothetical protein